MVSKAHTVTLNVHLINEEVLRVRIREGGSWWYAGCGEVGDPERLVVQPRKNNDLHERLEIPMSSLVYVEVIIRNPPNGAEGCEHLHGHFHGETIIIDPAEFPLT